MSIITENKKRKQEDNKLFSSSLPNTSWKDFIYSSPSSPLAIENNHFNFDSMFEHYEINPTTGTTNSGSRRHSVTIGEMDYHSFEFLKQDINIMPSNDNWNDIQFLLNSNVIEAHHERPIHKRTLSLRETNPNYAASNILSPTTPTDNSVNFFNQNFLDALVAENSPSFNQDDTNSTMMSDISSLMDTTDVSSDFLNSSDTSCAFTNEINNMANWLLEQQVHPITKKQRRSISPDSPSQSLSTHSPSPPITPMQSSALGFEPLPNIIFPQQHHSQLGDEWSNTSINTKSSLISARIIQGESTASYLKPLIQDYLVQREHQDSSLPVTGERTVMVLTSRVAQKSYGTEKRFLCPPPTTILKGANWWANVDTMDPKKIFSTPNTPPKLTIHISGETINQTGVIEWQSANGTVVDTNSTNTAISGRCVSKQLYINDADEKRKRVEVLAKIQLGNGLQLGTFPSKGIKVISKPSKKRQSIKNMELCIHHGTTISLFNRIRSQTVSTKYLGVSTTQSNEKNNNTCFVARTSSWDPFVIWIVDTSHTPDSATLPRPTQSNGQFPPPPAIALQSSNPQSLAIHYNQPVVLQCVTTGLVSPVMIIRKVDKGSMVLGGNQRSEEDHLNTGGECGDETLGDPVSQLHKVAFQIVQDPSFSHQINKSKIPTTTAGSFKIPQSCHPVTYLACLNDVVGMHKTTYTRHLIPTCQPKPNPIPSLESNVWTDFMQIEKEDIKKSTRRPSTTESKAAERRRSVAERRGSSLDASGLEGACWTEDVSDAAVWTIVGTDCASYTFWTPSEATMDPRCFNMPFNSQATTTLSSTSAPITPFPLVHDHHKKAGDPYLSITGENLTRDLSVWFGDVKAQTEYKSRDVLICAIPDIQELLESPTLITEVKDEQTEGDFKKKVPLLLVRGDGVVYRTNQFYTF